jgi:hypothetical protein
MDPTAALEELRQLSLKILKEKEEKEATSTWWEGPSDVEDVYRVTELVLALDRWIAGGGFLPQSWQR